MDGVHRYIKTGEWVQVEAAEEEPEVVRCSIRVAGLYDEYMVESRLTTDDGIPLTLPVKEFIFREDFIGYEYPDGSVWSVPLLYQSLEDYYTLQRLTPDCEPVRPTHVLFRGEK